MNCKFNLVKMNWKFKLMIAFGISLAAVVLLKLPASPAQADNESAADGNKSSVAPGKLTEYPNGAVKAEPQGFAVTGAVRDMPTTDPDALVKRANFLDPEKAREMRAEEQREEKGIAFAGDADKEINTLNTERVKTIIPGAGAGFDPFQDPLVDKESAVNGPQAAMPEPSLTFNGATAADNASQGVGALSPPDVNGDVGPNNYVSSVNSVLKMFNKSGAVVAGPVKTSALFAALPAGDPCRTRNDGDPIVMYDPLADRWHVSQFSLPAYFHRGTVNYQCVALSVTGDPTGAYYVWSYPYPGGAFNDYPKVGVWMDAYHITFNEFTNAGAFIGAGILSQDRKKALVGDPSASVVYYNFSTDYPDAGGLLPGDVDGLTAPPTELAEVIGEFRADEFGNPNDALRLYRWAPNFTNPGSSTLTVLPDVVLAAFDAREPASPIEQMGGSNLDALADRSMHRFAYRNLGTNTAPVNSYVGNFTVNVSGVEPTDAATYQAGIRWFEMRRVSDTFSVFDQGTHNPAPGNGASGLNNWMSSIAQDNRGDIAVGFSQAGTTQKADIKIAGRTNNVMNSGTLNEGEGLFYAAGGSQTGSKRWGDYSAMNVDPTDDCTFWYTQEYYAATSLTGWSTRVGKFRYPQCVDAPKATISGTISYCSSGASFPGASVDATGGFNRVTGAPGTYSMTVSPGTYTVSAGRADGYTTTGAAPVTLANGEIATVNICLTGFPVVSQGGNIQLVAESCGIPNGAPEPGETLTVSLPLQNTGAASTTNLTATLQNTGAIMNASPAQNYGAVAPGGGSTRNFSFKVNPNVACGSNITLRWTITDGATDFGNITYTIQTGTTGAEITTSYTGPPVAIPNAAATGVNIILPVSGITGAIGDVNFRFDALSGCDNVVGNPNASVTHTFLSDLRFKLTSPGGTTVNLIANRGGGGNNLCAVLLDDQGGYAPVFSMPTTGGVNGNFTPESPLSAFNGQNANGNWTLNVSDNDRVDTGTLNRFSLIIAPKTCSNACVVRTEADVNPRPAQTGNPTPGKSGDDVVTAGDVTQVNRFALGQDTPDAAPNTSNEFQKADCAPLSTLGDGAINAGDVTQVRRYALGLDQPQFAGGPSTRGGMLAAAALAADALQSGSVYEGEAAAAAISVTPVVVSRVGQTLTVGVVLNTDPNGPLANAISFTLNFNPADLSNPTNIRRGSGAVGTNGNNASLGSNQNAASMGRLGLLLSFDPPETFQSGTRQIVLIDFTVAGGAATTTTLGFSDGQALNPQTPDRFISDIFGNRLDTRSPETFGSNTVSTAGPTAARAAIGGRVRNAGGAGIGGVEVTLVEAATGRSTQTRTDADGAYRFAELEVGNDYIVTARLAGYGIAPASKQFSLVEELTEADFVATKKRAAKGFR